MQKINILTSAIGFFIVYGMAGTMDYADRFGLEISDTEIMVKIIIATIVVIVTFLFAFAAQRMEEEIEDEIERRKILHKQIKKRKLLKCDDTHIEQKTHRKIM